MEKSATGDIRKWQAPEEPRWSWEGKGETTMLCYIISWVLESLIHIAVLIIQGMSLGGRILPLGSAYLTCSPGFQVRRPRMTKTETRFPHES